VLAGTTPQPLPIDFNWSRFDESASIFWLLVWDLG
jgi:hypothetical protein